MSLKSLAVVSYAAHDPFSPRAKRTRALVNALEPDWEIELFASNTPLRIAADTSPGIRALRKAVRRQLVERALLDRYEPWSRKRFRNWSPRFAGAVLIGMPISPLIYAGAQMRAQGIPYVLDIGDPWVLTHTDPLHRWPAAARAARAERTLWEAAAAAIVTTDLQAEIIAGLFPSLPLLVRPNGYETVTPESVNGSPTNGDHPGSRPDGELRLIHFGGLGPARVEILPLLERVVGHDRWTDVSLSQYGSDWTGMLDLKLTGIRITRHEPVPWERATAIARDHDAVIVVGNRNSLQMPSKAVQSLTLPIPRIAVTNGSEDDALTRYVADKPGWLAIGADDADAADRVHEHVSRPWSAAELTPPQSEGWPQVAAQLRDFINDALSGA